MTGRAQRIVRIAALVAFAVLMAGCDQLKIGNVPRQESDQQLVHSTDPASGAEKGGAVREVTTPMRDPNQPIMEMPARQNGGTLREMPMKGIPGGGGEAERLRLGSGEPEQPVQISFNDASLRSVIDFLFLQYIKKPYTVMSDFKDHKVNWLASGNFTETEILRLFEAFLEVQGVTLSEREGMYVVSSSPQRADLQEPEIGQTTQMWRLANIDAKEVANFARLFVANADRVQVIDASNILVATAGGTEIRNLDGFIAKVDVPALANEHLLLYTPRYVSPQALVALLQGLPKRLGSTLSEQKKPIDADVLPGEPEVFIIAKDEQTVRTVKAFLAEIDNPNQDRRQVFYYVVRTQKADDIRGTLDSLLKPLFKDEAADAPAVIAHLPTNSLIITATPEQYYQIKSVIDRIDYALPSVLLDAVVAQVSLNNELAYGVEWFLAGRAGNQIGNFTTATDPFAGGLTGVSTPTATIGALSLVGDAVSTINLLSQTTKLQVLSRPRVIVANKEKATIKSVREEQVIASTANSSVQTTGGATQILNQFTSKEVGITLEVTPTIADDGTIKMLLHIEDSDQGPITNGQPSFDKRQVDTTLETHDGRTIFIGGIIKKNNTDNAQAVPGLADIPIIGNAFKSKDIAIADSELIIMLTPHVFTNQDGAKILTDAFANFAKPAPGQ